MNEWMNGWMDERMHVTTVITYL